MENWKKVSEELPPQNVLVKTKIDEGIASRNFQKLKRIANLWFLPDGMYVYYTPTHWSY